MRRRGVPSDPAAALRADASRRSLEAGGLPLAAQERLTAVGRGTGGAYTSDLTTNEFLLVREAGFRPIAQLMGSCVYQTGFQYAVGTRRPMAYIRGEGQSTPGRAAAAGYEYDSLGRRVYRNAAFGQLFELDILSEAWRDARGRAIARLSQEAKLAGADAVVGVRLRRDSPGKTGKLIEFVAVGTGVVSERYDLGSEPVLSNLSGQEFAALYRAGYWPVGLVVGTSVTYVMTGTNQRWARRRFGPNCELGDFTQGVQYARRVAMSYLGRQATALGAAGVVVTRLDVEREEHGHEGSGSWSRNARDLIVTAHAIGTAIVKLDREADAPRIDLSLFLNEKLR